jgi:phenylacetate-CoA oxygenase PaaI subunit
MTGSTKGRLPDPLARHILSLADTKRILGIRYSDWLLGAPSIETGIAASSMAQDEWGHARLLYAMLKDFGFDPFEVEHERPADRYYSAPALDQPFDDWADFTAAVAVVDRALEIALESLTSGDFELAQTRVPKMLAEEEFHRSFGDAWFRRLCEAGGEGQGRLEEAVGSMLPSTLAWLCPSDETYQTLVAGGQVRSAEEVRASFNRSFAPLASLIGLEIESAEAASSDWDEGRRRGPGAPGEEAVERARGDRNRSLLVE